MMGTQGGEWEVVEEKEMEKEEDEEEDEEKTVGKERYGTGRHRGMTCPVMKFDGGQNYLFHQFGE